MFMSTHQIENVLSNIFLFSNIKLLQSNKNYNISKFHILSAQSAPKYKYQNKFHTSNIYIIKICQPLKVKTTLLMFPILDF